MKLSLIFVFWNVMRSNHSTDFNRIHQIVLVFTDSGSRETVTQTDFHGKETKGYHTGLFTYLWLYLCVEWNNKEGNLSWVNHCGSEVNYDSIWMNELALVNSWYTHMWTGSAVNQCTGQKCLWMLIFFLNIFSYFLLGISRLVESPPTL